MKEEADTEIVAAAFCWLEVQFSPIPFKNLKWAKQVSCVCVNDFQNKEINKYLIIATGKRVSIHYSVQQ